MAGGEGMAGRHEGTEDLFLIAFSQEIEVGLKLPDSQADSQPPFAGFRSRLATIQPDLRASSRLPRLIRVKKSRVVAVATFVPFLQGSFISALHIPRENRSLPLSFSASSNIIPFLSSFSFVPPLQPLVSTLPKGKRERRAQREKGKEREIVSFWETKDKRFISRRSNNPLSPPVFVRI